MSTGYHVAKSEGEITRYSGESKPQAHGEAVGMLQLAASGEYSIEHLRSEIGESNDFRKEVLREFDALISSGKGDAAVRRARERSERLSEVRLRDGSQLKNGKSGPQKKLNDAKCEQIRAMFAEGGYSRAAIGRRFLVSGTTEARVLNDDEGT